MPAVGLRSLLAPAVSRSPVNASFSDLLSQHGFISQSASGVFNILPLGTRVQSRIESIVRKHLANIGASELAMTSLADESIWKASGRLNNDSQAGFIFTKDPSYLLAPTAEEQLTTLVGDVSYRQLPISVYQMTRKYRNELRPRGGLLRTREFTMKDLYTVDVSKDEALNAYADVQNAYRRIFDELGVPYILARADSGDMGGDHSHEFHYASEAGDDKVLHCKTCHWAANMELYQSEPPPDRCPKCYSKNMKVETGIEVAHTFHLGTRYSESMNKTVTLSDGSKQPYNMGSYGIGISRLIAATASTLQDKYGLVWPSSIAPAQALVVSSDVTLAEDLANQLESDGVSAVFENRTTQLAHAMGAARSAGWPAVVIAGKKYAESGMLEVELRKDNSKHVSERAGLPALVKELAPRR